MAADFTYGQKIFFKIFLKEEIFLDDTQARGKHFRGMHNFPLDLADSASGLKEESSFRGCQEQKTHEISTSPKHGESQLSCSFSLASKI